ncbi:MAG: ABC transporter permease, partial [Candidatus Sericytochromatia bacterium]|nr:ABC transporter permease [Candidatus Sericytochromatia bacterium]
MGDTLFVIAWEALSANKVRSALTMLGIIIGVMAVIVMIGMGQSSQAYITEQVQGLGASVLIVSPGNPKTAQFGPPGMNTAPTLTLDDAEALRNLPGIRFISANAFTSVTFKYGHDQVAGVVIGAMPAIQEIRELVVGRGRFFTEQESNAGARVMVVGAKLMRNLAKDPTLDPLTEKVRIEDQRYRIVGVLVEEGGGLFGSTDEQAFIPTRTYQQNLRDGKRINAIFLRVTSEKAMAATTVSVAERLRQRHRIRPDEDDDFKLQTQAELLATVQTITSVFTLLLAG